MRFVFIFIARSNQSFNALFQFQRELTTAPGLLKGGVKCAIKRIMKIVRVQKRKKLVLLSLIFLLHSCNLNVFQALMESMSA